jgi:hypothetical protein
MGVLATLAAVASAVIGYLAWVAPRTPAPKPEPQYTLRLNLHPGMVFGGPAESNMSVPGVGLVQLRASTQAVVETQLIGGNYQVLFDTGPAVVSPHIPATEQVRRMMSGSFQRVVFDQRCRVLNSFVGHHDPLVQNDPGFFQFMRQQESSLVFASASFPPNPVTKGATWEGTAAIPVSPTQNLGLNVTSTLDSVTNNEATILYTGTVTGAAEGELQGKAIIDITTGWPKVYELTLKYHTPGQFGPVEQTMSMRQEFSRVR